MRNQQAVFTFYSYCPCNMLLRTYTAMGSGGCGNSSASQMALLLFYNFLLITLKFGMSDYLLCLLFRHFTLQVLATRSLKYPLSPLHQKWSLVWAFKRWARLTLGYLTTPTLIGDHSPHSSHPRAWSSPQSPSPET